MLSRPPAARAQQSALQPPRSGISLSTTLRYSFATPDELPAAARLVAHSFAGPTRTQAWVQEQLRAPVYGGGAETLLLGREGDRLVAACQLHPLRQWVAGSPLACSGIGTVSVSPVHRRRSVGAALMSAALRASHERGDVASALYPFRTSFYQKLGYGQAGEALQYQLPPATLPDAPGRMQVELLESEGARAEALALYAAWIRGQTGQLERDAERWARICGEHDRALAGYRSETGALEGYGLLVYRADLPRRDRYVEVDELVWTTAAARRGLYAWLASLSDQWEQILIRALPSQRLGDWIREPRLPVGAAPQWGLWAPAAVLQLGPMFRIIDMQGAWTQRRVATAPPLTVAVHVDDPQLAENAGSWRLCFEEGRTRVEPAGDAELTVRVNISTLSRLYISSLRATAALEAGLLECDRAGLLPALDGILALSEPWTFDRF